MIHNNEIMNPNVITSCLQHYYDIINDPNFSTKVLVNLQRKLSLPELKDPVLYQQPSAPKSTPQIQIAGFEPKILYMNHIYDNMYIAPPTHQPNIQTIDPNLYLSEENKKKIRDEIMKMIKNLKE